MSSVIKEGYLLKYINLFKGWKKRYFILSGHELVYKDKIDDMKAKRIIDLHKVDVEMSNKDENTLIIRQSKKTFKLQTPNIIEKVKWVDALRTAKGNTSNIAHYSAIKEKSDEKVKQELLEAIQTMYVKEHNGITTAMGEIWSQQLIIEDVLSSLLPLLHQIDQPNITELVDKLDKHFLNLKTSVQEGMTAVESYNKCLSKSVSDGGTKNEDNKNEEVKEGQSNEFEEEFFDAIEKEEIKSEHNRSEEVVAPQRSVLPTQRITMSNVSIWNVLKELIGKDLSHFSIPVYFNEPLSMLQKIAEGMEFEYLLHSAAKEPNSLKRTLYVSAFLNAYYYNTLGRVKKPFNPILGETFEFVDKNFRFFSEQVVHHPPISALFAESEVYELWMHSHVKISFWGKSLEATPLGSMYIYLKTTGELFTINRPVSGAYNLIIGKTYIDQYGESKCINHKTGEKVNITFHRKGWKDATYGNVTGKAFDSKGIEAYSISGKWTDSLIASNAKETFLIWKGTPRDADWDKYYCYSHFTMQLNYLPESLKSVIPISDTRLRPDQRALENGNLKLASSEKIRLEEKQREARKILAAKKKEYKALYFDPVYHEITHETYYKFNGKYWKDRETKNWKETPDLF